MPAEQTQQPEDQTSLENDYASQLRQQTIQAKIKKDNATKSKEKKIKKIPSFTERRRSKRLMAAWLAILLSGGTSLLYINFHVFARMVISKKYCKLGHEWYFMSDLGKSTIRVIEIIALIFLNALFIITMLSAVVLIAWILENPIKAGIAFSAYTGFKLWIATLGQ